MIRASSNARINSVRPRDFRKTRAPRPPASFLAHPSPRFARTRCTIAITLEKHLGRFYGEIDRDVKALLKDGYPPLVVVGVEHEVALFRRLTAYPACVEPGIRGLPGHLSQNEMYRQSLELVRLVTTGAARRALERFDKQMGTRPCFGRCTGDCAVPLPQAESNIYSCSRTGPCRARSTARSTSRIQSAAVQNASPRWRRSNPYRRQACLPGALFARSSAMRQRVSNNEARRKHNSRLSSSASPSRAGLPDGYC